MKECISVVWYVSVLSVVRRYSRRLPVDSSLKRVGDTPLEVFTTPYYTVQSRVVCGDDMDLIITVRLIV